MRKASAGASFLERSGRRTRVSLARYGVAALPAGWGKATMREHHLSTTFAVHQRGAGASAVAHAAYIDAERYVDERIDKAWRFTADAERVFATVTLLPPGAPAAWSDPEKLFNAVERHEDEWADTYFRKTPERAEHHKQTARTDIRGHG